MTFEELEGVFRDADMNTYLIAKQQEVSDTHTIVNLQGKIDKQYVVSFQVRVKRCLFQCLRHANPSTHEYFSSQPSLAEPNSQKAGQRRQRRMSRALQKQV